MKNVEQNTFCVDFVTGLIMCVLHVSDLFEAVQPIFVTVWKFEPVQVLQRASVILRCHPGDLL